MLELCTTSWPETSSSHPATSFQPSLQVSKPPSHQPGLWHQALGERHKVYFLITLCSSQSGLCETLILPESHHPRLGVQREALHPPFFLSGMKSSLQHSPCQGSCLPLTPSSTYSPALRMQGRHTTSTAMGKEHPSCPSLFKRVGKSQLLSEIKPLWKHRIGGTGGFGKTAWPGRYWGQAPQHLDHECCENLSSFGATWYQLCLHTCLDMTRGHMPVVLSHSMNSQPTAHLLLPV